MNGNGADGIINPQPFQQFDAQNYDDPGYASKKYGSGGTDPITGASDGDKPGEKPVGRKAGVPLLAGPVGPEHRG